MIRILHSRVRPLAALALAGFAVAGCGLFGKSPPPRRCPPVLILEETNKLTKFRAGPGRDITDIEFEARIVDFTGNCKDDEDEFDVQLKVAFVVERGPANAKGEAKFPYFVAIPKFRPRPEGKRSFDVTLKFEGNRTRIVHNESLSLTIPISPRVSTKDHEIYIGMQLSPEQLRFNKSQRAR